MNITKLHIAIITATSLILLSACKQEESAKPLTADEKIITTEDSAKDLLAKARKMDDDRLQKQSESVPADTTRNAESTDNMSAISFDGSSEDSFNEGLDKFQAMASSKEYNELTNSLKYLLVYDFSTRGNKARLYKSLDGMTPAEIIERARNIGR